MEKQIEINRREFKALYASFGGVGYVKYAPGTFGSLATLPFLIYINYTAVPKLFLIPLLLFLFCIGSYLCQKIQDQYELKDPSWIVIDEVLGLSFAYVILPPIHNYGVVALFVLFRIFDVLKPWPISWIDKKLKNGFGVMFDDFVAGLMASVAYYIFHLINQSYNFFG